MQSREIIGKVLSYGHPPRIGWGLKDPRYNDFTGDGTDNLEDFDYAWHPSREFEDFYPILKGFKGYARHDEFGNLWGKVETDPSVMGEVLKGAMDDWDQLDSYRLPDFTSADRYRSAEKSIRDNPGKYRIGYLPGFPFSIMRKIRKMEYFLSDLILEKDNVMALNSRVLGMLSDMISHFGEMGMDAVMFCEDWGTQHSLLISPGLWREIFKPGFAILCTHAKEYGMKIFMHSCGYIYEILDDLIEVGIDVFQFDQPTLMGMEKVAEKFKKGKVTLFASCDIQRILPSGDKELIQHHARELIRLFASGGGGFIARDYGDYPTIQVSGHSVRWMHEVFVKEGVF
ncbi:MAG: uroporphyrinogen decarboxylase family protein [Clostridia bacterium]